MMAFKGNLWRTLALLLISVCGAGSFVHATAPAREVRAIWVTRWDYQTPDDVRKIIENSNNHHFNMVLFQVRGNATAYYHSRIEPWAWELTSDGPATTGENPGWDPLQLACYEARKRGLELHAYLNVFPGWRGDVPPPTEAGQLWTEHPEWFMVGSDGQRMSLRPNWYSFVNPANPEVKEYLVDVFVEVIRRYRIDGIHFDYLRYPSEIGDFSYDAVSLERFAEETGKTPDEDPDAWAVWRAGQVTALKQEIFRQGRALKPDLIFSAALVADPDRAFNPYFQDTRRWLAEGTLDLAIPMIYTDEMERLEENSRFYRGIMDSEPERDWWVACGLGVHKAREEVIQQIELSRDMEIDGVSLFSYRMLFPEHEPNDTARQLLQHSFQEKVRTPWR